MRIARVFPRRTAATPTDALAFVGTPGLYPPQVDEVHISVTFSWDKPHAEYLADQWKRVAPVTIGGPAYNDAGAEFEPGRYIAPGYVITSRGCPNHCWFCKVPGREGGIRELPIRDGWNVLDSNLLACSEQHIRAVCAMLARQTHRPRFTGGLEAARLKEWHAELLRTLQPSSIYFAYDTPDDLEPLRAAAETMWAADFTRASHTLCCYVLVGGPRDTFEAAEKRCREVLALGVLPMAMLYRDDSGARDRTWVSFQKQWARKHIVGARMNGDGERDE